MKILFSVLHFGLLRNFEAVIEQLAERGHEILIVADEPDEFGGQALASAGSARRHTTVLSLGLNVGGYIECDARIEPKAVQDGSWHHCAATFDGRTMRVYLDGRQIGSLERPGAIRAGGCSRSSRWWRSPASGCCSTPAVPVRSGVVATCSARASCSR